MTLSWVAANSCALALGDRCVGKQSAHSSKHIGRGFDEGEEFVAMYFAKV